MPSKGVVTPPSKAELASAEREYYLSAAASYREEARNYAADTAVKEYELRWDKVRAKERRVFDFVGEVTEHEVQNAVDELNDWSYLSDDPITVRLCSPGGSVFDGLFLYDFLTKLPVQLTVVTMGYGASMGSVLSQAGDQRLISPNTWFMVHEPSTIIWGKAGDVKREADLMKRLHEQLCGILADRSNMTKAEIKRRSQDKDWWMSAEEALNYGFFDGFDR